MLVQVQQFPVVSREGRVGEVEKTKQKITKPSRAVSDASTRT